MSESNKTLEEISLDWILKRYGIENGKDLLQWRDKQVEKAFKAGVARSGGDMEFQDAFWDEYTTYPEGEEV